MLTVIQTWTCALCGKCETIRLQKLMKNMSVENFPPPPCWHWLNENTLVCDDHVIVARDRTQEEKVNE